MPPPKKAAKKVPAKSAHHDEGKDLRRAYEHLGRVQALHELLGKHTASTMTLTKLAEKELKAHRPKSAADLLRAAEHLSFGQLASAKSEGTLDPQLEKALSTEFDHKLEKAEEHWEQGSSSELNHIYETASAEAQQALEDGAYRKALELVRAAEALAHVQLESTERLGTGSEMARAS